MTACKALQHILDLVSGERHRDTRATIMRTLTEAMDDAQPEVCTQALRAVRATMPKNVGDPEFAKILIDGYLNVFNSFPVCSLFRVRPSVIADGTVAAERSVSGPSRGSGLLVSGGKARQDPSL